MDWLNWSAGIADVILDVLLQKWHTRHLPSLEQLPADVEGRTCIVTGPTSGIGRQTAAALAKRNAKVVLACRSAERGARLLAELDAEARAAGVISPQLRVELLDVSSRASVRAFAGRWVTSGAPLHVLVNNAGIFNFGERRQESVDGCESHLATNCLGPHLLTLLLLPCLRATAKAPGAGPGRVVFVNSRLHRVGHLAAGDPQLARSYSSLAAYAGSKLAQVALVAELQRRLDGSSVGGRSGKSGGLFGGGDASVRFFAADPGEVLTDITRTLPGPLRWAYHALLPRILFSPGQGARSSVHCAGSPSALAQQAAGGVYVSSSCAPDAPGGAAGMVAQGGLDWVWAWAAEAAGVSETELANACEHGAHM